MKIESARALKEEIASDVVPPAVSAISSAGGFSLTTFALHKVTKAEPLVALEAVFLVLDLMAVVGWSNTVAGDKNGTPKGAVPCVTLPPKMSPMRWSSDHPCPYRRPSFCRCFP